MTNYKLLIAYNGVKYYGWQKQTLSPTIQQTIEQAIQKICQITSSVQLIGSGRTDRGVHAYAQTASIKLNEKKVPTQFLSKLNSLLPLDIRILSIKQVPLSFNARFSAKRREYRYYLLINKEKIPFLGHISYYYPYPINHICFKRCVPYFVGEKNFTSFSNSEKEKNPVRKIYHFSFKKEKDFIVFRIIANSYLQGMVRNIVGTILDINKNKQNPNLISDIFSLQDNKYCGNKAPAKGLFLHKVYY